MPAGSGRYPSGQRGQTVNLLAYAFGGSNPPLPTIVAKGLCTARTAGGLSEMGAAPTRPVNGSGDSAFCGNSSAVERQPSKLGVAGSNPVSRSIVATGLSTGRSVGGLIEARVAPRVAPIVAMGLSTGRTVGGLIEARVAPIVAIGLSTDGSVGGLFEMGVAPTGPFNRGSGAAVSARSAGGARGAVGAARSARSAGGARSTDSIRSAHVAQLAEHALGKGEVSGSIPDMGSRYTSPTKRGARGR
jgi:hypothetical protein